MDLQKKKRGLFYSQAEAGSPPPAAPTAPGRIDNRPRSAASPGRWGQRACNWPHREQRSLHHSLGNMRKSQF